MLYSLADSATTASAAGGRVLSSILGWTSTLFVQRFSVFQVYTKKRRQSLVYLVLPASYTELSEAQVGGRT